MLSVIRSRLGETLIPLLVWITGDALWGSPAGLAAGAAAVLFQGVRGLLTSRRIEPGLVADLGLMLILGLPEILPEEAIPPDLAGAAIELLLAAILAPAFFGKLTRSATSGLPIPEALRPALIRLTGLLAILLVLHGGLLTAYWAFSPPYPLIIPETLFPLTGFSWGTAVRLLEFATGPAYLFFAIPAAGTVLLQARRRLACSPADQAAEWLAVVDASGRPLARARRDLLHTRPDLIQHVVRLVVRHPQSGAFLLQKRRTDRAAAPGLWDTAAAGHVRAGEEATAALIRETREELGIRLAPLSPPRGVHPASAGSARWIGQHLTRCATESEYADVWLLETEGPFTMDRSEMDALEWFSSEQCQSLAKNGLITRGALLDLELAAHPEPDPK